MMRLIKRAIKGHRRDAKRRIQSLGDEVAAIDPLTTSIQDPLQLYQIPPKDTDRAIDNWTDDHIVAIDPSVSPRQQLFLFLCGSYGIPARQTLITQLAARMGYHAINLCYPNAWTIGGLCRGSGDNDCHGNVRLQIFDGEPRSELIHFTPANAIHHRLVKLLAYLDTRFPEQDWSQYLREGEVDWGSVVVVGHSQGGGQAALIGTIRSVARVVMLAAPADHGRGNQGPAQWLLHRGETPPGRYFGFIHREDQGFSHVQDAWKALGMVPGGPLISVENSLPPYANSQRLVTEISDVRRGKYHGCVAQDKITPADANGKSLFEPVWRYLLGG